jgi:nitrate reductase delta subunit
MIRTFKALSLLLSYPTDELRQAIPDLRAALAAEGRLPERKHPALYRLVDRLGADDLYELQERYVLLFDRTRSLSLHLFEHVHGESRDRGQAMVDLQAMYAGHGLFVSARELPDFLPLFLEFLATRPMAEARELLGQPLHVLTALRERLERRRSDYAAAFAALEALARATASPDHLAAARAEPDDDPSDLAALDRAWAETAVTFGPDPDPSGACPKAASMLQRMSAPPAGPAAR